MAAAWLAPLNLRPSGTFLCRMRRELLREHATIHNKYNHDLKQFSNITNQLIYLQPEFQLSGPRISVTMVKVTDILYYVINPQELRSIIQWYVSLLIAYSATLILLKEGMASARP